MIILNDNDISKLDISYLECLESIKNVLRLHSDRKVLLQKKISLSPFEGSFMNTMPCGIEDLGYFAVKVINRFPKVENRPSIFGHLLLYEYKTGNLLACMDASWLTAVRTGCVAALSAKTFGNTCDNIGLIGLGNTCYATIRALESIASVKNILVYEYKDSHTRFKNTFHHYNVESTSSLERIVKESPIIVSSITYAKNPFVMAKWLQDGTCVIPIHTRGWQLCDPFFDKTFVDDYDHVKDFLEVVDGELGSVLNKKIPGRESSSEKIICYNIGIAIDDLAIAKIIYEKAVQKNIGQTVYFPYKSDYIIS